MATITLNHGLNWENIPQSTLQPVIDQAKLLDALSQMRAQWNEATGGDLDQVTINLRLLFADLEQMIKGSAQ